MKLTTMELNDKVKVTLTKRGAEVMNENNEIMSGYNPRSVLKLDHKEGDVYECFLWQLFEHFGCCNNSGDEHCFTNLKIVSAESNDSNNKRSNSNPNRN